MPLNCWEFKDCGREPGGRHVAEQGVCPAARFTAADGYLGGVNGGRACAFITGTFCEEVLQGTYRDKSKDCWDCPFFHRLRAEHGADFSLPAFALFLAERDGDALHSFSEQNGRRGRPRLR